MGHETSQGVYPDRLKAKWKTFFGFSYVDTRKEDNIKIRNNMIY